MNSPAALVGRHVLRNFGKHDVHKGTIASYDDDGELTFRVEYIDGDFEDLSQEDVEATLVALPSSQVSHQVSGKRKMVRVMARSRRAKGREDSESDYIEDESHSDDHEVPPSSQATTQPFDFQVIRELTQPEPTVVTENRQRSNRQRCRTGARLRSTNTLWIPSVCPTSVSVHYNAVDRGLCAQTLREHHTVLERAMGRVFPRFKWGKSHYLQVGYRILLRSKYILIYNILNLSFITLRNWGDMDFGWAGNGHVLRRHIIALRKGWRLMREAHGLQPIPKHILPTIIVDHNMHKGGADQKKGRIAGLWRML